jgi:hypothetical protein
VAEPNIWRAGDGGSAMCGGLPYFLQWLPLATSYLDRQLLESSEPDGAPQSDVTGSFVRRVSRSTKSRDPARPAEK